jgi:shikimate kinase
MCEIEASRTFDEVRTKLKSTCVYFIGMMGSGKTSVGEEFAKLINYRFMDTDGIAELMIEMPISQYFSSGKEQEFRELESQILMELVQYTRLVVSTGGGCVMRNENWGYLRHGIVVYLDLPVIDIYNRLQARPEEISKRPLLRDADPLTKLTEIYEKRKDRYALADISVTVSPESKPSEIAYNVAEAILNFIKSNPPMWQEWERKRDAMAIEAAARVIYYIINIDININNVNLFVIVVECR